MTHKEVTEASCNGLTTKTASRSQGNRHKAAPSLPRLLSIEMVATIAGVSQKTVRRWISAGELPVYRLGRQLRISEVDLGAFIARSRCS